MQLQCGNQVRNIRSEILDRDMFDPCLNTRTYILDNEVIKTFGSIGWTGSWDRPAFEISQIGERPSKIEDSGKHTGFT